MLSIFSIINESKEFEFLRDAIEKQIKENKYFIDLRPFQKI